MKGVHNLLAISDGINYSLVLVFKNLGTLYGVQLLIHKGCYLYNWFFP